MNEKSSALTLKAVMTTIGNWRNVGICDLRKGGAVASARSLIGDDGGITAVGSLAFGNLGTGERFAGVVGRSFDMDGDLDLRAIAPRLEDESCKLSPTISSKESKDESSVASSKATRVRMRQIWQKEGNSLWQSALYLLFDCF